MLGRNKLKVSPSILSADFSKLGEEIQKLSNSGADYIHIDVMDGQFTENITIGSPVISQLKKHSSLPFDVHLMIENVEEQVESFVKSGADIVTFHHEAAKDSRELIKKIRNLDVKVGISIIPSTPVSAIEDLIPEVDLVLIMTVNPGYAGQKFLHSQLSKISEARDIIEKTEKDIDISVDGGIDKDTAKLCVEAGASILVSGSYIFSEENSDYSKKVTELSRL
jgi:ribulose-phosphate 3-epimerase